MTTKFIAEFKSNEANLYKVNVVSETEKTLLIKKPVKILGWIYLPNRIKKSSYNIFDTHTDALIWLVSRANQHISDLMTRTENARQTASYLSKLLYEVETKENADKTGGAS